MKGALLTFRRADVFAAHRPAMTLFYLKLKKESFQETSRLIHIKPCFYIVVKIFLGNCGFFYFFRGG